MNRQRRWGPRIVGGALGLVVLLAALAVLTGRVRDAPASGLAAGDPAEALATALDQVLQRGRDPALGVAMRPLAPASSPPDMAARAEAACAAIAERLARLPTLRVVPCRSTAAAVATELDDRRLAQLLAVGYIFKGSVEPLPGDRLQLRLGLWDVARDREVWQLDDAIEATELQSLPRRVATASAHALGLAAPTAAEATIAPALYAKYLRAGDLARRLSLDDRRAALALLDDVVQAEPDHVPSLFLRQNLRGYLLGNRGENIGGAAEVAALNAARASNVADGLALARRIVARDPADLRGQGLLLSHEFEQRQWVAGFERLDEMLRRAGHDPGLLRLAARLHLHAGYVQRAHELALAAARLNALDAEAIEILALVAGIQRRDEAMRELLAIAKRLGHQGMGRVEVFDAFRRADWAELERAHTAWVSWGEQWPAQWVAGYVRGLADPAQREAAARVLDGHDAATRQHFVSYFIEYALLGDAARSLQSVRRHASLPPATWMQHLWWPELAAVRRADAFVPAMRQLGKVALWEVRGAPDLCVRGDGPAGWTCR